MASIFDQPGVPTPPNTQSFAHLPPPPPKAPPTAPIAQHTALPPTPPSAPVPPQTRTLGDAAALRQAIFDRALESARSVEPVKNELYTLQLSDVDYSGPERYTKADHKKAVLTRGSLARKLQGTWTLLDNKTGDTVAQRRATLAAVPYLTESGTFVNRGVEYTLAHQMRLRPGVYAREKDNGELEAHVNTLPGKGRSHRYQLDPATGVFKINIGQASIPLFPLLKTLGVSEHQIREAWGNDLASVNMQQGDAGTLEKLYQRLSYKPDSNLDASAKMKAVTDEFAKMQLDPEVTKRTLGKAYDRMTPEAVLDITKKLIKLNKKEIDPDDRDSMTYQTVVGPEDLLAERFVKDKTAIRQLLWKATAKRNLDHVPTGVFNKAITAALIGSGLGASPEEINPLEIFDQQQRVTRLGEGGIGSLDAVPAESRAVQPSHFGFVDFLRTPECYDRQTEVMTRRGWKFWADITTNDELACLVDGRLEFHFPHALHRYQYDGLLYGADTGRISYLVTPEHRLWVRAFHKSAQYKFETAQELKNFRKVLSGGFEPMVGDSATTFRVPRVDFAHSAKQVAKSDWLRDAGTVDLDDWAEFVGWYLGEGSCQYVPSTGTGTVNYQVQISQSQEVNAENCARISALLDKLPFKWTYYDRAFHVATKQIAAYFKDFGPSNKRYIPEYLLCANVSARRRLFDALMLAEGRKDKQGVRSTFCTTSDRLAVDFERLAFSLGIPTTCTWVPDERPQANNGGCWEVWVHKHNEHQLHTKRCKSHGGGSDTFTQQYRGYVYCATVPGGLLYVRRGKSVGHWSGNSSKAGIDMRFARGAVKGRDGKIYTPVKDIKTGETVLKTPQELADIPLAFPGSEKSDLPMVAAIVNGKLEYVPREQAQYTLPTMDNSFSQLSNMIPLKSMVKGQRAIMGARMLTQALPLENAEAPLVQSAMADDPERSYEDDIGNKMGAVRAEMPARVVSVTDDEIVLRNQDGTQKTIELFNTLPLNRKTFWSQKAMVQPGDVVQPGQLIATSNFTDKNGSAALGLNMRVAYLPYRGKNYEDAVVISESAAKRLSSQHMYQHEAEWEEGIKRGKNAFVSIFPQTYDKKMLEKFDEHGAIKKGTVVNYGDPLVLIAKERPAVYGKVHGGRKSNFVDESVTWEHHSPGVVTDVEHTKKGVAVVVKNTAKMEIGDKLSGRVGDKGVISDIIPDDQMPKDSQGRPFEVLVSPLGLINRVNPMQAVEAVLGKIAEKTGKPFKLKDFDDSQDLIEFAQKQLRLHNLSDTEDVEDPETGRKIKGVLTGNRFFMKLHHTSESKLQGRATGAGYTAEGTPAKGGAEGAKRVGLLDSFALLSHGAGKVIRDAKMVRGQANPEYWSQFMGGYDPPLPKVPHVYNKFVNQLKASGINVVRTGTRTNIMALTDKDVDELAGDREIQNAETVDWKGGMRPKKGGLFDEALTGGLTGNKWGKITLHEPMPNPAMEEPIRRVLGLTQKQFRAVLAGDEKIGDTTGPRAIQEALANINLPKAIEQARADIKSGRATVRDAAVRRLGFLKAAESTGVQPKDWMMTKVPVLPPMFRPVSVMGAKKLPLVSDANYLYKELLEANNGLKSAASVLSKYSDERLNVYDAVKAVTGLGDPTHAKNVERKVKGFLQHVFGSSPKYGTVQRQLLSTTVDLVGRAVITPNPDLDMDEVALPEDKAWEIYKPFVVRNLVRRGMPRMQALDAVKNRTKPAAAELETQMSSRPIVVNRAPVLHRYGMMAFKPRLTKNKVMELSPIVTKGFNADFDGDAMQFHVPSTPEAAEEAIEKMLPSRNLFSVSQFKAHYLPNKDYQVGLYLASARQDKKTPPKVYADTKAAIAAYKRGEISVDTPVHIVDNKGS